MRCLGDRISGRVAALAVTLTFCSVGTSRGQVIYVNTNQFTNSVSALAVAPDGTLTPVPGSPFLTGGTGLLSPNVGGVDVVATDQFLYATNAGSDTIAAFTINDDGSLTTVPGSPFPTLGTGPIGIVANSTNTLLFVANSQGNDVSVFNIEPNGALSLVFGSPYATANSPLDEAIDTLNSLLFVSQNTAVNGVGVYTIGAGGSSLSAIAGSPFGAGGGERGLDVNASHTLLYVADASNDTVSGFSIGAGGVLNGVSGSPFAAGTEPTGVLLHPSLNVLYVSNDHSNDIDVYSIDISGVLTNIQTVSSGGNGTAGMVIDAANRHLFAVNGGTPVGTPSRDVSVFNINPSNGMLSAVTGSPFPTGASGSQSSAIALASFARPTCTAAAPGTCILGTANNTVGCYAEWLVSTASGPQINPRTNLPKRQVFCQNGNSGCDFDGDATDGQCTFHLQVCFNNQDPRISCSVAGVQLSSFELLQPRPGSVINKPVDNGNITALETAVSGKTCNNSPQTRSCLTNADCVAPGTCTDPPIVGLPFVQGLTTLQPGSASSTLNNCSNVMSIQVPLRSTILGQQGSTKRFLAKVKTAQKKFNLGSLALTCLPAP
jgi:6-phosphogluconolactonase (cycloisomerase 2 family)